MAITGFFAYPSTPESLPQIIREAVEVVNKKGGRKLQLWEENDIAGRPLTAPIFSNIANSDVLVADVSIPNFNVTFEIGFAIGNRRRVYLVRDRSLQRDAAVIQRTGIFDTLGYDEYDSSDSLAETLLALEDTTPLPIDTELDRSQPVYILQSDTQTHVTGRIVSRIKKARLQFRSFVPAEESRLSAMSAINHVASSFGIVVPLISQRAPDAKIPNIRAAFVAGLAHGMTKTTLIVQDPEGPAPLDVKDLVKTFSHPQDLAEHIHHFSLDVYEATQAEDHIEVPAGNLLSRLRVGDPMAENEFRELKHYYLQTDEFARAMRGDVNLVVGRKGTGKTALFSQVRDRKRSNKRNVILDLKPEGYQLVKLKEHVLDYLSAGAKAHLVTAFWEYLLYMELCYKLLEKDKETHLRDPALYDGYQRLRELYQEIPATSEGDFSERLLSLADTIVDEYGVQHGEEEEVRLTAGEITNLLHAETILDLRRELGAYLKTKEDVWILFDNLDKGWSAYGLKRGDIVLLRSLIDAARKMQRELSKEGHDLYSIVFIRNDVYQLLMDESPDFGKESRASLDWTDSDALREMLRKRLVANDLPGDADFHQLWRRICVSLYHGEETSQFLIDRSLMRPRNLLKLFQFCKGFAVNLHHDVIGAEDLEKGLRSYSNDLLVDADQELTDIEPQAKGLIYQFIGESPEHSEEELKIILSMNDIGDEQKDRVIDFLLYYGFLGIRYMTRDPEYIFDVGYDMRLLQTRINKNRGAISYMLNSAFWPALGIEGPS